MDREAWHAAIHGFQSIGHHWSTELNWTDAYHALSSRNRKMITNVLYKIRMCSLICINVYEEIFTVVMLPSHGAIEECLWMKFIKSRCILHILKNILYNLIKKLIHAHNRKCKFARKKKKKERKKSPMISFTTGSEFWVPELGR